MTFWQFVFAGMLIAAMISMARGGAPLHRCGRVRPPQRDEADKGRLRDELMTLKERLAVLERITVEKETSLEREIEALRHR